MYHYGVFIVLFVLFWLSNFYSSLALFVFISLYLPISVALTCLPLVFLFSHLLVFLSLVLFQPHPHRSSPHPSLPSADLLSEHVFVWEGQWVRGRWSETMWVCVFVVFCVSSVLWVFYIYFKMKVKEEEKQTLVKCGVFFPEGCLMDTDCRFCFTSALFTTNWHDLNIFKLICYLMTTLYLI